VTANLKSEKSPLRWAPTNAFKVPLVLPLALLPWLGAPAHAAAPDPYSIVTSKHNLAASGPGDVRATTENDVCVFCHTPHSKTGLTPLWNHELPNATYTPYSSTTLRASVGQPTGSSKLCLSCHDGTVALGMVRSRSAPIPMRSGGQSMPAGPSRLGTDLSGHHPISFVYDSSLANSKGELRDPKVLQQEVRLDKMQQVQCTSCHDPHRNQYGKFLVKDNTASAVCLDCHAPNNWSGSAHAVSTATWNGSGKNPWPRTQHSTVAANGCENCHTPHAAGTKPQLLNFSKAEDNCLVCHNGSVAAKNLTTEFSKPSSHPILATSSLHDAAEGSLTPAARHVSCVDCHNPHAARSTVSAGGLPGSLAQVRGAASGGSVVPAAAHEYEICFRCHAEAGSQSLSKVSRQMLQPNARLQFNPGNASYHPVLAPSKSGSSRSLLSTWTAARQMVCTDCHNNDQGPSASGVGPKGPHGSRYAPLLERNLVQVDFQPESASAYALCYKCHSQSVLMSDRLHSLHVRDQQAACTTCHDSHGVQNQAHLINFNTLYVKASAGRLNYTDLGGGQATCTLSCHGKDHSSASTAALQFSTRRTPNRR
jgi:predicted CXXCH cytochrome family protein